MVPVPGTGTGTGRLAELSVDSTVFNRMLVSRAVPSGSDVVFHEVDEAERKMQATGAAHSSRFGQKKPEYVNGNYKGGREDVIQVNILTDPDLPLHGVKRGSSTASSAGNFICLFGQRPLDVFSHKEESVCPNLTRRISLPWNCISLTVRMHIPANV